MRYCWKNEKKRKHFSMRTYIVTPREMLDKIEEDRKIMYRPLQNCNSFCKGFVIPRKYTKLKVKHLEGDT